jgi:hypothetical protein
MLYNICSVPPCPQVALPPFRLLQHAPAALRLCAPDVLEQEVVREDAAHDRRGACFSPTVCRMLYYTQQDVAV